GRRYDAQVVAVLDLDQLGLVLQLFQRRAERLVGPPAAAAQVVVGAEEEEGRHSLADEGDGRNLLAVALLAEDARKEAVGQDQRPADGDDGADRLGREALLLEVALVAGQKRDEVRPGGVAAGEDLVAAGAVLAEVPGAPGEGAGDVLDVLGMLD